MIFPDPDPAKSFGSDRIRIHSTDPFRCRSSVPVCPFKFSLKRDNYFSVVRRGEEKDRTRVPELVMGDGEPTRQ
jgi:hypothetical protein